MIRIHLPFVSFDITILISRYFRLSAKHVTNIIWYIIKTTPNMCGSIKSNSYSKHLTTYSYSIQPKIKFFWYELRREFENSYQFIVDDTIYFSRFDQPKSQPSEKPKTDPTPLSLTSPPTSTIPRHNQLTYTLDLFQQEPKISYAFKLWPYNHPSTLGYL